MLGRAAGLFGTGSSGAAESSKAEAKQESAADGLATVPDLVGKTEEEAKTLANDAHLGVQMAGEEASDQEKGRISRQETAAGTQVEANTTVKYWVSTGTAQVTIPDLDGRTGIDAQQTLEDLGLQVNVQKEYSDTDDNGYALVDPGYVYNVEPAAGTSVQAGSSVTLTVSRGVDYGDNAEVPSVVGMTKDDALTTLGKFIDIQITEQQSTEAAGTVIAQDPEAYAAADPDQPISITISSGDQAPSTDSTASADSTVSTTTSTADVNANTGWKCTQTLDTPSGYNGGAIRLELIQDVNGEPKASTIIDGQNISFPYQLDISGAEGVTSGTIYLYEEMDGDYQQLGTYTVAFKKAE